MDYDKIILEALMRIQVLEEKVKILEEKQYNRISEKTNEILKITTTDIRNYIESLKNTAKTQGNKSLILTAREIHGNLNLKSRYPMVCNAMKQIMLKNDEVIFSPKSGYSSTLKIKYYL